MKKLVALLLSLVLAAGLIPVVNASTGFDLVRIGTTSLGCIPEVAQIVGDTMLVGCRVPGPAGALNEGVAKISLKNPDQPMVTATKKLGKFDKSLTDIQLSGGIIYILHKQNTMTLVDAESLATLKCGGNWWGIIGTTTKDGLYTTAWNTENDILFYPTGGGREVVEIDEEDVPVMDRLMITPMKLFFLNEKTMVAVGEGTMKVAMSDSTHGKVIGYVPAMDRAFFGMYPAIYQNRYIYGGNEDGESNYIYILDAENMKDYKVSYKGLGTPWKFEVYGRYLFVLTNPSGAESNALVKSNMLAVFDIVNPLKPKLLMIKKLDFYASDIKVYLGRVYLLDVEGQGIAVLQMPLFTDLKPGHWAYAAAAYLVQHGVLSGYPDGSFKPDKPVTRAEYAKMLAVATGLEVRECKPDIFKDVKDGDWFCPYVTAVHDAGYMVGYPDGRFGPNNRVKKEEILTTLVRLRGWELVKKDKPTFEDITPDYWAYRYVETAVAHKLVWPDDTGITNGRIFGKGQPATRAQTAVLIYRGTMK